MRREIAVTAAASPWLCSRGEGCQDEGGTWSPWRGQGHLGGADSVLHDVVLGESLDFGRCGQAQRAARVLARSLLLQKAPWRPRAEGHGAQGLVYPAQSCSGTTSHCKEKNNRKGQGGAVPLSEGWRGCLSLKLLLV